MDLYGGDPRMRCAAKGRPPPMGTPGASLVAAATAEHTAVAALLGEALGAVEEATRLREKIAEQRRRARERSEETEASTTAASRADAERLWHERAELEAKLAQQVRQIHALEGTGNDLSEKRTTQSARARKMHHCLLKATANTQAQAPLGATSDGFASASRMDRSLFSSLPSPRKAAPARSTLSMAEHFPELREMHGMAKQYTSRMMEIEDQLSRAYVDKEHIEAEIAQRRHAAAITEALHRARLDALGRHDGGSATPPQQSSSQLLPDGSLDVAILGGEHYPFPASADGEEF
eukprot:CAMPEP_0183517652 /NCGR_PEP_ID=MMETSP0371-20130417/15014_1 /TAXON_ID=268820 /ORGANISM="Peridinium aciculiferum, Strain PAER-2" /LENGTH=292 /DNA_ID=CAMNT_0025715575 /DNA_START=25 /DNA_END=903 /DNA_ORIENTATION=-